MDIGERLRFFREEKKLSQGDIEQRTGLLRCYLSRVENGHTIPAVKTLEKWAKALGLELYQLLYDGDEPPIMRSRTNGNERGGRRKDARFLRKMCKHLARMSGRQREALLAFARKLVA